MATHFSYDISKEERKEYFKEFPLYKKSEDGTLMRRTHLYVLKNRRIVDGKSKMMVIAVRLATLT